MRLKVKKNGLLIPKHMLSGFDEVEVPREHNAIVVLPIGDDDPIFHLGKNPIVIDDVTDASVNLDKYLYGDEIDEH